MASLLRTMKRVMLPPETIAKIIQRLEKMLRVKILDKGIRAIHVNSRYHWQPKMRIEVGKYYANLEFESPLEKVVAVLEAPSFIVITEQRGLKEGMPYLFMKDDVKKVEFFEL